MDIKTGTGVRRRRGGYDDDSDEEVPPQIEREERPVVKDQKQKPPAEPPRQQQQPEPQHRPPFNRPYKKPRLKYQQFRQELEELEAQELLTPREQSRLDYLADKLNNWKKSPDEYDLPSEQQSKHDVLHKKSNGYQTVNWETEQFNRANQLILQNDDKIHVDDEKDYEFVFDESQFVNYDDVEELPGDEEEETEEAAEVIQAKEIDDVRKSLPVYWYREDFLKLLDENQVLIVVGETGSGKTTQLPQYLHESGYSANGKMIACTQPRRVAATSVAARVASEMQVKVGKEVGYTIRFDDNSQDGVTVIKYATDGMLVREFLQDLELSRYSAIMIDEAHERTLSTEILLSLLKDIMTARKDLKIIIASATINAEKFSKFFGNAPILNIPGRRFPVKIHYTKQPEANYIQAAITTIFQIHMTQPLPGDVLVFLTGQDEIETMEEILKDLIIKLGDQIDPMIVCPIYANLPQELQSKIFQPTPPNTRKIVLATNIAETSITIDGISYVIDPGYVKQNVYNPTTGMESLVVVPCSRASADQRAGRAGRVGPGKCFRLFTKWSFYNELELNQQPEIQRVNLTAVILLLLSLGINDLIEFEFMDAPSKESIIKSLNLLYALGALNSLGKLTKVGKKMSEFPLDPIFTKCILTSEKFGNTRDIVSMIAMLNESSNLFYRPKDKQELADKRKQEFFDPKGDHFMLLEIWKQWVDSGYSVQWCQDYFIQYKTMKRVRNIYEQLIKLTKKIGIEIKPGSVHEQEEEDATMIMKCLISGFFNNIVKLSPMGDCYSKVAKGNNTPCYVHPSSCVYKMKPKPKFLLYYELVLTSKEYMRNCIVLDEKLVKDYIQ
ncbi:Pre-mRNA-splicing factor ATP-dependent RNA helicase-like protein cdc28 [Candida viswanathii]|uniref:RNA helicase n=1 Tax=Candida viswanathii TaxID=5486 RepID=A0A367XZC3_9ASCO|nr:Pre-mRNA-splicing factor ATP-dependent RNA helicase-like protein cdc28 [Candida viswanathii]